jgi:CRISPR-associated protein Csm5
METYKHVKLKCKTITPVHIGSGETLASIGDYYTSSNQLLIIDKEKLDRSIQQVKDDSFINRYMDEIKKNVSMSKSDFSIVPFLKNNGIKLEDITSGTEIPILTTGYESHRNSQLKLAMNQNGQLYLPGSSVKGAIKTVLFYNYLLSQPDKLNHWNRIIENSQSRYQYLQEWEENIEYDFEQFFKGKKCDYNLLRVEDSHSLNGDCRGIWETARFHLYKNNDEMVSWLTEAIKAETSFELMITILPKFHAGFLDFFNNGDLTELFGVINRFSFDHIKREMEEIEASNLENLTKVKILNELKLLLKLTNSDNQALIRIGAGKSFYYNTVCNLLDKTHFEMLRGIAKIGKTDESIFPLTRTMTTDHDMLGWVLMELPSIGVNDLPINEVTEIEQNKTVLKAMVIEDRKVRININHSTIDVQLVLTIEQKNIRLTKGEIVNVTVKQMSNDKRIIHVQFESKSS